MSSPFTHLDSGTPETDWRRRLAGFPARGLPTGLARLVVVAAHPDDEALGVGGLIAAAHRGNVAVSVIIASDGEGSHPNSPSTSPAELARERRAEATRAVATLAGCARVRFLGRPDGKLGDHVPEIEAAIAAELADGPTGEAIWLLAPLLTDGHPDHEACASAARAFSRRPTVTYWEYPIWYWHWAAATDVGAGLPGLHRFPLTAEDRAGKQHALACYASQSRPLSSGRGDEAILQPAFLAHFDRPYEALVSVDDAGRTDGPGYFDRLYAASPDPWEAETRWYEQRKRAVLLASLPAQRYERVFEPGCSTGLLTVELARRGGRVVAGDVSTAAVDATRARRPGPADLDLRTMRIPDDWPDETFDLIVLSEVAYYCPDLQRLARRVTDTLSADGTVVLCHWRHPAAAHLHTADFAHRTLIDALGLTGPVSHVEADFRLDVLTADPGSVAERTGVVA